VNRPRICAVIVDSDLTLVRQAEELADLFEVRIDLVGEGWQGLAAHLDKPWIACNRRVAEGGQWQKGETERIGELLKAVELGAAIIDIELETTDLTDFIPVIKKHAQCLVSFHDLTGTPPFSHLKEIVQQQLAAGADICKVVTTAQRFEDNITVLRLIKEFPNTKLISFTMGSVGLLSRILCPPAGGDFTYASMEEGREAAPGQITVRELRKLYEIVA
jgi:3-dehydroquinate dehydratase type I